ncbi:MAG TPA: hypothetical protein VJ255_03395 [Candidatus Acidoferrum sp.]|nr:hypothetical protein [Candidatus Acidoferrum sp.]
MQIRAFLAGQALGPETIREMSLALESIRETLGMRLIDDPATRLVAQKIIQLRQRGLRGDTLQVMTLEALKQKGG